jgi:hypothetical protein
MKMLLIGIAIMLVGSIGPIVGGQGSGGGWLFMLIGLVVAFFGLKKMFPRMFVRK